MFLGQTIFGDAKFLFNFSTIILAHFDRARGDGALWAGARFAQRKIMQTCRAHRVHFASVADVAAVGDDSKGGDQKTF